MNDVVPRAATDRWTAATAALAERDPDMAAAVADLGPCTLARRRHPGGAFGALARSIVYQQLAGRAAAAIHARFLALYGGRPTPQAVMATADAELRAAGLSANKAASVKDLARRVVDGSLRLGQLRHLDDEAVVARLSAVRGIGRWTAEMFLVFQLNRPDVWPVGDLGVRSGFALLKGMDAPPTPARLRSLGEPYRPYRTVAAWYCWRLLDGRAGVSPGPEAW